jgi:hypothetical protein
VFEVSFACWRTNEDERMAKKRLVLAALLTLAVANTSAQQDARGALQSAAAAMGAGTPKTVPVFGDRRVSCYTCP